MSRIFIFFLLLYCINVANSQSVSVTYSVGDIPTSLNSPDPVCNGININVPLPAGPSITVTGVDINYNFTAISSGWMSDQRSFTVFPGQSSAPIISGVGDNSGTYVYSFPGEMGANGTYPGGHVLVFKFFAYRVFGSGGSSECNVDFNKVDQNTLTITVHYSVDLAEGSVGIGTSTPDISALLELRSSQKGFLPPRMSSALMNAIPNPVEGLMVYCSDCNPAGMYSRVNGNWTAGIGNTAFVLDGNLVRQNSFNFTDDFVFGRDAIPDNSTISDTLMFFDNTKAAFRGGRLQNSNAFGGNNIGLASFAFGVNTIASGPGSIALGSSTSATAEGAFAAGSTAMATEYAAAAVGEGKATGYASFASGDSQASGENSVAMGFSSDANGEFSIAIGQSVESPSWGEITLGNYNELYTPISSTVYNSADRLFSIGNGQSGSPSNAMTVLKNGNVGLGISTPTQGLELDGNMTVHGFNSYIEMGASFSKHPDAGKIRYFNNILSIYGGGSTDSNRRMNFYAEGGAFFDGTLTLISDNDLILEKSFGQPTVEILASEGTGEGAQISIFNDTGVRTIELDADFGTGKKGHIRTDIIEIRGGSDFAEYFDVNEESKKIQAGMVVCIDEDSEGQLVLSKKRFDKKVIGVISGANGIDAGMIMGQKGTIAYGDHPVSLIGRVYVKCNLENGSISPGDFLTSSSTQGEAMRVDSFSDAQGAILGKALSSYDPRSRFVLVLVNLQ